MKSLLTGLFRAARKRTMTTDNDMGMFRTKLEELVAGKDSPTDEDVAAKVDELKGFTADLPDSDDKAKLDRFLEDFKAVKEQDEAAAKEAAGMVADLFEKLDTEAMKDVPEAPAEEAPAEEPAAPEAAEEAAPEATEEVAEIAEETEAPAEEGKPEDAEPGANADYTLEEIYQFIKKRMAEDAACQDEAPEAEEEAEEEETEEEEVVTDHAAPFIPITVNNNAKATGSLAEMFAKAKETGGR